VSQILILSEKMDNGLNAEIWLTNARQTPCSQVLLQEIVDKINFQPKNGVKCKTDLGFHRLGHFGLHGYENTLNFVIELIQKSVELQVTPLSVISAIP